MSDPTAPGDVLAFPGLFRGRAEVHAALAERRLALLTEAAGLHKQMQAQAEALAYATRRFVDLGLSSVERLRAIALQVEAIEGTLGEAAAADARP